MITRGLIFATLFTLLVYGLIEARPLISGPSLSIASPLDGASVPGGVLEISGNVKRAVALAFDGAAVLPDEQGDFSQVLAFPRGTSILTFAAADRFGKTISETRSIVVP